MSEADKYQKNFLSRRTFLVAMGSLTTTGILAAMETQRRLFEAAVSDFQSWVLTWDHF